MRALVTLGLIGAIGYTTSGTADPAEIELIPREQAEVHGMSLRLLRCRKAPARFGIF